MTTSPLTSPAARPGRVTGLSEVYSSTTQPLAAQNPGLKNIDAQLSRDGARLSNIGKLALALDTFRDSASKLTGDKFDAALDVSGKAVSAQLTDAGAAGGSHTIEVKQLAQGQQLASKPLADRSMAIDSGTASLIKVETGSGSAATSKSVRIGSGNNTLDGIATALRDAGLDAKVVADGKGFALSLTGPSGAANTMRIGVVGDPALQGLLAYGPGQGTSSAMTQQAPAQDAQLTLDGKALVSSTNKLDAALPGIALTLREPGKSEVATTRNPAAIAANVKELVGAFNTLGARLEGLQSGDPAGDALLGRIRTQLGNVLDGAAQRTLAEAGVTRKNGSLVLDEAKLNAAIAAAPDKLNEVFGKAGTGLAAELTAKVTQQLATGGMLADQAAAVQGHVDQLNTQRTQVTETLGRQAGLLAQQYAQGGTGGSSLFGPGTGAPTSLFDMLG
jgi:flagellar hook-associated protein 2